MSSRLARCVLFGALANCGAGVPASDGSCSPSEEDSASLLQQKWYKPHAKKLLHHIPHRRRCNTSAAPLTEAATELPTTAHPITETTAEPVLPTTTPATTPLIVATTDAPMLIPTLAPTLAPPRPTEAPILKPPLKEPTLAPVLTPTAAPTRAPPVPTKAPSLKPQMKETTSAAPLTEAATELPTTAHPITETTAEPVLPTTTPATTPLIVATTDAPMLIPTLAPTLAPPKPTEAPILKPSLKEPTLAPVLTPTAAPTRAPPVPTKAPSLKPQMKETTLSPTSEPLAQVSSKYLWPRLGLTHQACVGGGTKHQVGSQRECQEEATKAGDSSYSFLPLPQPAQQEDEPADSGTDFTFHVRPGEFQPGMCATAAVCIPGPTDEPWRVYQAPPKHEQYCLAWMDRGSSWNQLHTFQHNTWEAMNQKLESLSSDTDAVIIDTTTKLEQFRRVSKGFNWADMRDIRKMCGIWTATTVLPHEAMHCAGSKPVLKTQSMTEQDYDDIVDRVFAEYSKLPNQCNPTECPRADFSGCILRMAGHDFMDFENGQGGSDACTDMEAPDNAGLAECLYSGETYNGTTVALAEAYKWFCHKVSLADFLVVAAETMMAKLRPTSKAGDLDDKFKSRFKFGRTTSTHCPGSGMSLPDAEKGCPEVRRVFMKNMGLKIPEAAALMAVHSLGRAQPQNSGYDGWWNDPINSRTFDNAYYRSMLTKGWGPEKQPSGKHLWRRSDVGRATPNHEMMLNTDMCLVYKDGAIAPLGPFDADFEVNAADPRTQCCAWMDPSPNGIEQEIVDQNGGELCGRPMMRGQIGTPTRTLCCDTFSNPGSANDCGGPFFPTGMAAKAVRDFAHKEDQWLLFFMTAWTKATENGVGSLQALHSR